MFSVSSGAASWTCANGRLVRIQSADCLWAFLFQDSCHIWLDLSDAIGTQAGAFSLNHQQFFNNMAAGSWIYQMATVILLISLTVSQCTFSALGCSLVTSLVIWKTNTCANFYNLWSLYKACCLTKCHCFWRGFVHVKAAWRCRDEIFDMCRNSSTLAKVYSEFIGQQLSSSAAREESTSIAALITEPGGWWSRPCWEVKLLSLYILDLLNAGVHGSVCECWVYI